MAQTASLQSVATLDQGFASNEIEDVYASHLDLNGFCTVDNELQGVAGDIRKINVYGATGSAEKVAEGQGNSGYISTTLIEREYRVQCAQAWFPYSDEAYMRDPVAIQTGVARLGASLFDEVNADLYGEMAKATRPQESIRAEPFLPFGLSWTLRVLPQRVRLWQHRSYMILPLHGLRVMSEP